jgi:hypothetical protein
MNADIITDSILEQYPIVPPVERMPRTGRASLWT